MDSHTGNLLFEHNNLQDTIVMSSKKRFIVFRFKVWERPLQLQNIPNDSAPAQEVSEETLILDETFSRKGKTVLIQFPLGTLGDMLAWSLML